MTQPSAQCRACRFWKPTFSGNAPSGELSYDRAYALRGDCRIRAPYPPRATTYENLWPTTDAEDWCGEFQAAAPAEASAPAVAAPPSPSGGLLPSVWVAVLDGRGEPVYPRERVNWVRGLIPGTRVNENHVTFNAREFRSEQVPTVLSFVAFYAGETGGSCLHHAMLAERKVVSQPDTVEFFPGALRMPLNPSDMSPERLPSQALLGVTSSKEPASAPPLVAVLDKPASNPAPTTARRYHQSTEVEAIRFTGEEANVTEILAWAIPAIVLARKPLSSLEITNRATGNDTVALGEWVIKDAFGLYRRDLPEGVRR